MGDQLTGGSGGISSHDAIINLWNRAGNHLFHSIQKYKYISMLLAIK
jgi:hypothetical protein